MESRTSSTALSVLVLLMAMGCGCDQAKKSANADPVGLPVVDTGAEKSSSRSASKGASKGASKDVKTDGKESVSDEEAAQFSKRWLSALRNENREQANELVAWDEILQRAVEPLGLSRKRERSAVGGAKEGILAVCGLGIPALIQSGASYELVGIQRRNEQPYVLFRLVHLEGELNYHLFRVQRIRGKIRADQLFIAATGEDISDSLRNSLAIGLKPKSSTGSQANVVNDMKMLSQLQKAVSSSNYDDAIRTYERMPERLKKEKLPKLYYLMATQSGDETVYAKACDDFIASFPDSPAGGFVMLDSAVMKGDMEMLLKAYRIMDTWTGGDPYLDLMVGANLAESERLKKAVEITEGVDPSALNVSYAHDFKLTIAMNAKDYGDVLQQLQYLRDDYGVEFEDLSGVEGYEGFVASPQFRIWEQESKSKANVQ